MPERHSRQKYQAILLPVYIGIRRKHQELSLPITYQDVLNSAFKPKIICRVEQGRLFIPL